MFAFITNPAEDIENYILCLICFSVSATETYSVYRYHILQLLEYLKAHFYQGLDLLNINSRAKFHLPSLYSTVPHKGQIVARKRAIGSNLIWKIFSFSLLLSIDRFL